MPSARSHVVLRESAALARQALLFSRSTRGFRETAPAPQLTVFIHGYCAWGGVFSPLSEHLAEAGVATRQLHYTYAPIGSVAEHARRLDEMVREAHPEGPVHIVGHSLGGLVGRYYAQVLRRPVERLVCIATPHHGTLRARRWAALPLAGEIAPGSATLRLLDATRVHLNDVRVLSLVADDDALVAPVDSAVLEGHESVRLAKVGHQSILFDARAWAHAKRVLSERQLSGSADGVVAA